MVFRRREAGKRIVVRSIVMAAPQRDVLAIASLTIASDVVMQLSTLSSRM
jgi:hypothetical protein